MMEEGGERKEEGGKEKKKEEEGKRREEGGEEKKGGRKKNHEELSFLDHMRQLQNRKAIGISNCVQPPRRLAAIAGSCIDRQAMHNVLLGIVVFCHYFWYAQRQCYVYPRPGWNMHLT